MAGTTTHKAARGAHPALHPDLAKHQTITTATVVALVQAVVGVALSFGLSITNAQSVALLALVTLIAGALIGGDAHVRAKRQQALADVHHK